MDSSIDLARSPPPFAKQVVANALKRYRDLALQLHAKKRVLSKLGHATPKSLQQKMTLSIPSSVRELHPQKAEELERSFDAVLAQREQDLHAIVQRNVATHVSTLEQLITDVATTATDKLESFFMRIHIELVPDDDNEFHDYVTSPDLPATSVAVADFRLSLQFLHERLTREVYDIRLLLAEREIREEERLEAQHQATSMEFDQPTSELVAQLVQRSIAKETAKLNKEINSLRAQLNGQATPKVAQGGKKKQARPAKPSAKPADGGKAAGRPRDGRRKKPEPKAAPSKRAPRRTRNN